MTTRAVSGRFWQAQGVEEVELLRGGFGQAVEAALASIGGVFLDACEEIERGAGAGCIAPGLQPHAHDAVKDKGEEADERVGADAIRQAVVDRGDLDVGLQHPEAALDVGQRLVARDGLGRLSVLDVFSPKALFEFSPVWRWF